MKFTIVWAIIAFRQKALHHKELSDKLEELKNKTLRALSFFYARSIIKWLCELRDTALLCFISDFLERKGPKEPQKTLSYFNSLVSFPFDLFSL